MNYKKRSNKYKKDNIVEDTIQKLKDNPNLIFGITEPMLNVFCSYVLSENGSIHRYGLTMMKKILDKLRPDCFNTQIESIKFSFIVRALDLRLNGINDKDLILADISNSMDIKSLIEDTKFIRELSNYEVGFVENNITSMLDNELFAYKVFELRDVCNAFIEEPSITKREKIPGLKEAVGTTMSSIRRNELLQETSDMEFSLFHNMKDSIHDIHKKMTNPSFKLITGMQGLNALLGGGFEKQRVYCFFGMSGDGKSTTLENILYQLWKYNKGYKTKDKTKKPCIVLLTMENFVSETVCNLFNIFTKGDKIESYKTAEDAIKVFEDNKVYWHNGSDDIEIRIKFQLGNSVTTSYLYTLVENLEDEGFEVIALLQDYMGRIQPEDRTNDSYQDLGHVIDDFKNFAMIKEIPVITAAQLNRDAIKMIDEGRSNNRPDLLKGVSRAQIGESIKIDQNLDGGFIIAREYDIEGHAYMGFKLTKKRYQIFTNKLLIYQPLYDKSKAYVEDIYETRPAFKETLSVDSEEVADIFQRQNEDHKRATMIKGLSNLKDLNKNANQLTQEMKNGMTKDNRGQHIDPEEDDGEKRLISLNRLVVGGNSNKKGIQVIEFIDETLRDEYREKYKIPKVL